MKEFIIVSDNDCHWYVIPSDKENHWNKWLISLQYEDGIIPNYAQEIGGSPRLVKFTNYRIE